MSENKTQQNMTERSPIVVVMGHIDHGKSKLLDYIRKTNVVDTESGGITQHLSAYEAVHKTKDGAQKKITFLDTPGHDAFSSMRSRGAHIADVAILVVSAEDGVKAQTLEALDAIKKAKIPYVVAINKIDKENASIEKTKKELLEKEIYLEGLGGDIPYAEVSAKEGTGISDLLDLVVLVAELEELSGDKTKHASGVVIESHVDPKKGTSATLVITNGTLKKGQCISAGNTFAPVRTIEDFLGNVVQEASFSSPIRITGFNSIPPVGSSFESCDTKKEAAEKVAEDTKNSKCKKDVLIEEGMREKVLIPIVIKTDVAGTIEAIEKEMKKVQHDDVCLKVIQKGVGDITEGDVKSASGSSDVIIIGFRVRTDSKAIRVSEQLNITIETFAIIYAITDYLEKIVRERAPKKEVAEETGKVKILKIFSKTKDKQVIGGDVKEGLISKGACIKIMRRDTEIGEGVVMEIQEQKVSTSEVKEGGQCGMMVESRMEIAVGDTLIPFIMKTV